MGASIFTLYRSGRFQISVNPLFLAMPPIMILAGIPVEFGLVFLSILLHEAGHICVALILKRAVRSLEILPLGLTAVIDSDAPERWKRAVLNLGGPAVNIILFLILLPFCLDGSLKTGYLYFFLVANAALAVFNLIPIYPLDGGKLLFDLLREKSGIYSARRACALLTLGLSVLLVLLGVLQLAYNRLNCSLLLAGIYSLSCLKSYKSEASWMNIKSILDRRTNFIKRGIYPSRELAVLKSLRLGEALRHMDFDRFHIFYILDEDLRIYRVLTEQEVMEGMLKYGTGLTFEELGRLT